jgi:hypothetical protein
MDVFTLKHSLGNANSGGGGCGGADTVELNGPLRQSSDPVVLRSPEYAVWLCFLHDCLDG